MWTDNPDQNLYIDNETGETLTYDQVLDLVDDIIDEQGGAAADSLYQLVADGEITVKEWQDKFGQTLKWLYMLLALLALSGGLLYLFNDDFRKRLEDILDNQYKYLSRFALEIATGAVIGGAILRRMRMYVNSARQAFWLAWDEKMMGLGYTEERWLAIGDKNTCSACSEADMAGWQPIGTFGQPGSGDVRMNPHTECEGLTSCRCRKLYRKR
jgi:hypothetical protein